MYNTLIHQHYEISTPTVVKLTKHSAHIIHFDVIDYLRIFIEKIIETRVLITYRQF